MQSNSGFASKSLTAANVFVFIARSFAAPLELLSRRQFGPKYFGFQALGIMVVLPMWPLFFPDSNPAFTTILFWLCFLMFVRNRAENVRAAKAGEHRHTRYNGYPRLASVLRSWPERRIKAVAEPVMWFGIGAAAFCIDRALGSCLIAGAVSLVLLHSTFESVEKAKAEALNDALIEQRAVAERFRAMQNSR